MTVRYEKVEVLVDQYAFASAVDLTKCLRCGSVVLDQALHDAWHNQHVPGGSVTREGGGASGRGVANPPASPPHDTRSGTDG